MRSNPRPFPLDNPASGLRTSSHLDEGSAQSSPSPMEIFEQSTRLLANPLASPEDIEDLDGWTLHRLRHSAMTHDAEGGTSTPMLLARSRHASVRSLERYARPGLDGVARHVAAQAPAARRR